MAFAADAELFSYSQTGAPAGHYSEKKANIIKSHNDNDISGDYLSITFSHTSATIEPVKGKELINCGDISLIKDGNNIIIDWLFNYYSIEQFSNAHIDKLEGSPVATISDNSLKVAFGQQINIYTLNNVDYPMIFAGYTYDETSHKISSPQYEGEVTFDIDSFGNMTADKPFGVYIEGIGWARAFYNSKIVIPNATIDQYINQSENEKPIDIYVERIDNPSPNSLLISNVTRYPNYSIVLTPDPNDSHKFIASSQIIGAHVMVSWDQDQNIYIYSHIDHYLYKVRTNNDGTYVGTPRLSATISEDGNSLTFDSKWSSGYFYTGEDGNSHQYLSQIKDPARIEMRHNQSSGVNSPDNDIIISNDEPIEYFNLQGMKISHPQSGTLVIRRQGSKTDKIIVP
ncbi:MAG: hypothetical protein K2L55_07490 [Muribaculaceae bacterium]|nr:hypothetical protein [Muribaculaceae bacterium]